MTDAVILVGGRGKRLGKLTIKTPKPLTKINNVKFLDILINKITRFKFTKIYLLCSYKKKQFYKYYHKKTINKCKIICLDEGSQKDTGGALFKVKNKIKSSFFLFNGDSYLDLNLKSLLNFNKNRALGTVAITTNTKYKKNSKLNNIKINKSGFISYSKSKTKLMNGGVYFFKNIFLNYIVNKRISLENDILHKLILDNKIKGYYTKSKFIDIGTTKNLKYLKKNLNFFN
jgi:NDP-sugar pyrophosphorylase family protein